MSAVRVTIKPAVLEWAVHRTGLTVDDLQKDFPKIPEWLEGSAKPTLNQARSFAKKAHVPFGRLLLDAPTGENVGIADFRTIRNTGIDGMSPDLQETIFAAQNRLSWYSEYANDIGIEPPRVLGVVRDSDPESAAREVRQRLGLNPEGPVPGSDKVSTLVSLLDDSGVLVCRNSIVGNATKRKLLVEEFRGFTLIDGHYCLVFINTRDVKTAQLFSVAHELGHVVRGTSGISDHSYESAVEQWCNSFAAAFLAPASSIETAFDDEEALMDVLMTLSRTFGMSREATLWRLVDLKLVDRAVAKSCISIVRVQPSSQPSERDQKGAPPRHILTRARVGHRFFEAVTEAAENGAITERTAARFLGAATHESFTKLLNARTHHNS